MSKEQALVPLESRYPVIAEGAALVREVLDANLPGEQISPFDLERIKVPGGGSTSWQVHSMGEIQEAKELAGIIVHQKLVRAFWSKSLDEGGGNSPPDCYSDDSLTGHGTPGGDCLTCPFAEFKSDPKGGGGQACKQSRLLFLLREGEALPAVIALPPSSLKRAKSYLTGLISKRIPMTSLVTVFGLERDKNQDGINFARATLRAGDRLSPEAASAVRDYAAAMRPALDQVKDISHDVIQGGE